MTNKQSRPPAPPRMNPYVFTALLMGFGLWCFWDGWLTNDPDMAKHAVMNRVLSLVLIPWAVWDFFKVRARIRSEKVDKVDPKQGG